MENENENPARNIGRYDFRANIAAQIARANRTMKERFYAYIIIIHALIIIMAYIIISYT